MTEFTVLSDHKLLKGLFAKNLAAVDNIRMRQCMERLQEFNFKVNHIVGKKTTITDTLRLFPTTPAQEFTGKLEDAACVCKAVQNGQDKCFHEQVHSIPSRVNELDLQLSEQTRTTGTS